MNYRWSSEKHLLHKMQMSSAWVTYNCGNKYFKVGNYSDDCYFPQATIKMIQITTSLSPFFSKFFPTNIIYQGLGKWLQLFHVSMHCFEMSVTVFFVAFGRMMHTSSVKFLCPLKNMLSTYQSLLYFLDTDL